MVEEQFTDAERRTLIGLVINAIPRGKGDAALQALVSKLAGVDTVLVARRAYPSRGGAHG